MTISAYYKSKKRRDEALKILDSYQVDYRIGYSFEGGDDSRITLAWDERVIIKPLKRDLSEVELVAGDLRIRYNADWVQIQDK